MIIRATMTNPRTSFSIMAATPAASAISSWHLRQWEGQMSMGRVQSIRRLFRVINRYVGILAPMPGVFPQVIHRHQKRLQS